MACCWAWWAFDLLPEALDQSPQVVFGVPAVMLTAVGGFFTIHILERSLAIHRGHEGEFSGHGHGHGHAHGRQTVGLLAGSGLVMHSVLDGVGIGISFQAGATVGIAVAIAVIAHDFADGFNTFTITSLYGNKRNRALTLLGLDAAAPVVGAVIGSLIAIPTSAVGLYLGYFAGVSALPGDGRHPARSTRPARLAAHSGVHLGRSRIHVAGRGAEPVTPLSWRGGAGRRSAALRAAHRNSARRAAARRSPQRRRPRCRAGSSPVRGAQR